MYFYSYTVKVISIWGGRSGFTVVSKTDLCIFMVRDLYRNDVGRVCDDIVARPFVETTMVFEIPNIAEPQNLVTVWLVPGTGDAQTLKSRILR